MAMDKQTISFRLDAQKVRALDTLAESLERDRSYLLNEAVDAYLDVQRWQMEQIEAGLRQANAGKLVDHEQVKKQATRWRSR
jgi:predicted transcriptional regulator